MKEMKYVVVLSEGKEQIFLFSPEINHNDFAEVLNYLKVHDDKGHWFRTPRKLVSAGFTDGNTCYGRSETLNLNSRPKEDSALLSANSLPIFSTPDPSP